MRLVRLASGVSIDQMVMIAHLAISMAHLVEALADLCKGVQPVQAILIGEINVVTPGAA